MQTNNELYKQICENMGITIDSGFHSNHYYLKKIAESYGLDYTGTVCDGILIKDIARVITGNTYTGHHFNNFYLKEIAESLTGQDYNTEFDNYYLTIWSESITPKNTTNLSWDTEITDFVYSDNFNASGILTSDGNPVSEVPISLMVGDTVMATATTDRNGVATFNKAPVHTGVHRFYLKFNGNALYKESSSTIVEINVTRETSVMTIYNNDEATYFTDEPYAITGELVDNDGENIGGKTITVTDGTHTYSEETEADGSFVILMPNLTVGSYTFDIEFSDSDYTTSTKQLSMNIIDPYMTGSATKSTLSYVDGDSTTLNAVIHSGVVANLPVNVYQDNEVIDVVRSNSSGEVSYVYESQGVGDTELKFEVVGRTSLSKRYDIIDNILYKSSITKTNSSSAESISIYDNNIEIDLPSKFEFGFILPASSANASGIGLFPKNEANRYGLYGYKEVNKTRYFIIYRDTASNNIAQKNGTANDEVTYKWVVDNGNISADVNGTTGTASVSFFENYNDFTLKFWSWASGTITANNVYIKPL